MKNPLWDKMYHKQEVIRVNLAEETNKKFEERVC